VTSGGTLQEPIPGWLVCNGAAIPTDSKYDKLKLVLGNSWGTNLLPDLRGTFLRGVNNGRTGTYADVDNRNVGSFQTDDNKQHNHTGTANAAGRHSHTWSYPRFSDEDDNGYNSILGDDETSGSWNITTSEAPDHTHTLSINNSGGAESRPKNAAIVYIIKY
jgi:microcystin-dependent protein